MTVLTSVVEKRAPSTKILTYNMAQREIREAKFTLGMNQDYLAEACNMGTFSLFATYLTQDEEVKPSPIYYIDHEMETEIAQVPWRYQQGIFFEEDKEGVFECEYEIEGVDKFRMTRSERIKPW